MTLLPQLPNHCHGRGGRSLPKYVPFQGTLLPWQSDFGQCCHCHAVVAGVYRLYKNDKVIYVGVAVNLKRRIQEHRGHFDRFDFVEIQDAQERRRLELALIRKHVPKLNDINNPIQRQFSARILSSKLQSGISFSDLCEQMWQEHGMTAATFHHLRRQIEKPEQMNTKTESLPVCPFCDNPREGNLICPKCGADLVWMIPWGEGGAALPMLENATPDSAAEKSCAGSAT